MIRNTLDVVRVGVAATVLCAGQAARAEPLPPDPPLQGPLSAQLLAFSHSAAHQAAVAATAQAAFMKQQACPSAQISAIGRVASYNILGPLAFGPDGQPISGVVSERVSVSGCASTHIENILTLVQNGQLKLVAGMPGTTLADPVLVHDSFQYAYTGALRKLNGCKAVKFVDSSFDGFEGPPNPLAKFQVHQGKPWREVWTLNGCGTLIPVTMHYVPDETGTTIRVTLAAK